MTIAQKLIDVNQAKQDIKTAIEAKGVSMTGVTFPDYHTKIAQISGGGGTGGYTLEPNDYVRNPEYPLMSANTLSLQPTNTVWIMVRIRDLAYQTVTMRVTLSNSSETYYVQWGDGGAFGTTNSSHNSNTVAEFTYDYNQVNTGSSFAPDGTLLNPQLSDGSKVTWIQVGVNGSSNITSISFVEQPSWGAAAGNYYHRQEPIREIYYNCPSLSSMYHSGNNYGLYHCEYVEINNWTTNVPRLIQLFYFMPKLRKVKFPAGHQITYLNSNQNPSSMFAGCGSLQEIENLSITGAYQFNSMFDSCYSLTDTGLAGVTITPHTQATTFAGMFSSCYNITKIPASIKLQSPTSVTYVNSFSNLFYNCVNLQTVEEPIQLGPGNTDLSNMFRYCYALTEHPELVFPPTHPGVTRTEYMYANSGIYKWDGVFDMSNCIDVDYMFRDSFNLSYVNNMNTTKCQSFLYMFYNCYSLENVYNLDTSSGWNFNYMFYSCLSLSKAPTMKFDQSGPNGNPGTQVLYGQRMFGNCQSMTEAPAGMDQTGGSTWYYTEYMFYNCKNLEEFNQNLPLTAAGRFRYMFQYCTSLVKTGSMDFSVATSSTYVQRIYQYCYVLQNISNSVMSNLYTVELNNLHMDTASINQVYTNLPTVTSGTIRTSGNPGYSAANHSIATAKGWTVT